MAETGCTDFLQAFAQSEVLRGLAEREITAIAGHFKRRGLAAGAVLFREGEPADTYFFIVRGRVKVVQTSAEGFDVILHILGPGEWVGALPTLGQGTYPATVTALQDVLLCSVSALTFEHLMREYALLAVNMLHFAASKLQATHRRLREMATERVEYRIARTLARLASQVGRPVERGILLDVRLSRQDLAEMTGTTLYTVSRILKRLERAGILKSARLQITILDPHALQMLADDLPRNEAGENAADPLP